jgi:hypothetical protein
MATNKTAPFASTDVPKKIWWSGHTKIFILRPLYFAAESKSLGWLSVANVFPVEDSCLLEEKLNISFRCLLFHREKGSKYYTARPIGSNP